MSRATPVGGALLSIRNLCVEGRGPAGRSLIVRDLSLQVRRGEVLGLIGESGAGKSTVGLAAMGYAREGCTIAGGVVDFLGTDMVRADARTLQRIRGSRITYVAQSAESSFNPSMTIGDQLVEGLVVHRQATLKAAREKARQLYSALRLPPPEEIGRRYPHQLSGGQLQRAMISMALASDPDLIVFDEPTTALDVTTQLDVLIAVRDVLARSSASAIYVTHDIALVAQVADRIAVMRNGSLVEEQRTAALLAAPVQEYTRRLVAKRPFVPRPMPAGGAARPILEVEGVDASYAGRVQILRGIDLKVMRGQTVAVVGESGSGKSTLARVLCGLLPATAGRITFDGVAVEPRLDDRSNDHLRRIQFVQQSPDLALNPSQTVGTIIGRPVRYFHDTKGSEVEQEVRRLLDMLELPADYARRYPRQLSGGEKQRVAIARALAAKPEIIVCDEVTSALDQLVAAGVLNILSRLKASFDVSYVFITHDLAIVRQIADDVVVMKAGKIVDRGSVATLFSPPMNPYTALLALSTPEMDPEWLKGALARKEASGGLTDSASAVAPAT